MAEKMQIKQHEPEIETNNIWKDDQLEVKKFAARLTSLLQGQTEPLTVALNGAWGSGKTFLLKRWCEDLKKQGHTAIYFNAWEDDQLDDPLVAIIGQLWIELHIIPKRYSCPSCFLSSFVLFFKDIKKAPCKNPSLPTFGSLLL